MAAAQNRKTKGVRRLQDAQLGQTTTQIHQEGK
jgi:hypothetical protein